MSSHEKHIKMREHFAKVAEAKGTFTNNTDKSLVQAVTKSKHEEIERHINKLINDYEFPLLVLQDVQKQLSDSHCPHYALQQLRYLENNIHAGIATKREDSNK